MSKLTEGERLFLDLARVPFSLYVFLIGFLIFHLVMLSYNVTQESNEFKNLINSSCLLVQNASNVVVNMDKIVGQEVFEAVAQLANDAISTGMKILNESATLAGEAADELLELFTDSFVCTSTGGLDLAIYYFYLELPMIEEGINNAIATLEQPFEDALSEGSTAIQLAQQDINGYMQKYNNVSQKLAKYDINLGPYADALPTIKWPTIPTVNFPEIYFPNTSHWQQPNFQNLSVTFFNSLKPDKAIQEALDEIPTFSISASQLEAEAGITNQLDYDNLTFCERIDYSSFDDQVNNLQLSIFVCVGICAFLMLSLLLTQGFLVVWKYKKGTWFRPRWLKKDGTTEMFLRHIWHTPSLNCLMVGLLGILIIQSLLDGVQLAKQDFEQKVLTVLLNDTDVLATYVNKRLDNISFAFADGANAVIDDVQNGLIQLRNDVNSSLQTVVEYQGIANNYLNEYVGTVPYAGKPLLEMIACLFSELSWPINNLTHLIPDLDDFPRVPMRILTFNLTKMEIIINRTLLELTTPFDWYIAELETDIQFYYYLTAYGCPVFFIGVLLAFFELATGTHVEVINVEEDESSEKS